MLQFISNDFKIDLTHLKIHLNDINPWLQEDLISEYSFPFDMALKDWVKTADFSNYNSASLKTEFVGKLFIDGILIDSTLKIQEHQGDRVTGVIFAGLDGLKVLDFPLSEIPFDIVPVSNLKEHAQSIIIQDYPDVKYNFPMIHSDKYDPESSEFKNFKGILNNYVDGDFIENQLQEESNIDDIFNIMQPLPYLMHVLKKGFDYAGMKLEGDIVDDEDLNRALLFRDGSYYKSLSKAALPLRATVNEYYQELNDLNGIPHVQYIIEVPIERKGDYIITGSIYSLRYKGQEGPFIKDASNLLLRLQKLSAGNYETLYEGGYDGEEVPAVISNSVITTDIDISVTLEAGDVVVFTKIEPKRDSVPSETPDYPDAVSLNITPVRFRNSDGTPILSVLDLDEINLSQVVPDMTLIELLSVIRKWKNFGVTMSGKTITMDYVEKRLNRSLANDMSSYDIEEPLRTFLDERSFELLFTDGKKTESFTYESVLITKTDVVFNSYTKNDNAISITIDGLFYPFTDKNGANTAYAFDDEPSKLRLVFFRKMLEGGRPLAFDNQNMSIRSVYNNYYKRWLDFRVNSVSYKWDFIISAERMKEISIQSLQFAYNNYHVITELEKERITPLYWRVTAKSESLQ
ncbi:hypothetical protein [Flavobacterium beibuense]|uniref:hypothetical protein n=1 Tax=Flavobacterium beibuense TaxID=657326 RepID=UPI003A909417